MSNKLLAHNQATGWLFVVAAPSGGGKSSLVNALLEKDPEIQLSVSHTTRSSRPGEVEGRHYYFVDNNTFKQKQQAGDFIETAEVFGNNYGTSKQMIDERLKQGKDVILDIDWQGAQKLSTCFPNNCVSIYVLPPSVEVLEQRLRGRGQDDEATIHYRMSQAEEEISHVHAFDYLIINDDFSTALGDLLSIVRSTRLKRASQWLCCQTAFSFN